MLTLSKIFLTSLQFYEYDFLFDIIGELIFFVLHVADSNDGYQNVE